MDRKQRNRRKHSCIRSGIFLALLLLVVSGCGKEEVDSEVSDITESDTSRITQEETTTTEEIIEQKTEEPVTEFEDTKTDTEEETEQKIQSVITDNLLEDIENTIQEEENKGTTVSVYVGDLTTGDYISLSKGKQRSASLIKLYVAGCVYEQMETLAFSEAYDGEINELIKSMITVSDNDATNTLVKRLGQGDAAAGMTKVNEYCQAHGFHETYMGRLMLDFSSSQDNYTSVEDCAHFLEMIYQGELVGADSILAYMKQQERVGKLPAGVPSDIETANKTGELEDVENDVAIIYADETPYIICVMMSELVNTVSGRETIVKTSAVVYEHMSGTKDISTP